MRLTRLEIEAFRGYNRPLSFDCLADVVILHGPNGSGKTSFFDAVSWGLFGDITRLRGSRDVIGDAHIVNAFASDAQPQVSLHVESGDATALVTRHGASLLVVADGAEVTGSEAQAWITEQFQRGATTDERAISEAERRFLSAHLLGQEEVASFLRSTNPRDRFDSLASLLGVDLVRRFYSHTGQVEKSAKSDLSALERRVASFDQRLETIRVEEQRLGRGSPVADESPTVDRLLVELRGVAAEATELGATTFLPTADGLIAADLLSSAQELGALLASLVESARRRLAQLEEIERRTQGAAERASRRAEVRAGLERSRSEQRAAIERVNQLSKRRAKLSQEAGSVAGAIENERASRQAGVIPHHRDCVRDSRNVSSL